MSDFFLLSEISGSIVLTLLLLYLNIQLYAAWCIRRSPEAVLRREYAPSDFILVWTAVRNEEEHLPLLIESLRRQTVPLEVHFGEDGSTDRTPQLLRQALQKEPTWRVHTVPPQLHETYPGKQAVLVHLEQNAPSKEHVVALADGDMVFPTTWAEGLYRHLTENPTWGGVSAPSLPYATNLWEGFQRIEWASVLALIAFSQAHGYMPTAIGNNLMLRRIAWQSIGGWKSIRPSLVEDYALKESLEAAGWQFRWVFHSAVVGETRAEPSVSSWFQQRLRWAKAVKNPPLMAWLYWLLQTTLPWILLFSGKILLLLPSWFIAEALPLMRLRTVLQVRKVLRYLPLLLVYRFFQGPLFLRLATRRGKITWRGRIYPANL